MYRTAFCIFITALSTAACDNYVIRNYFSLEGENVTFDFQQVSSNEVLLSWSYGASEGFRGFRIVRTTSPSGNTNTVELSPDERQYRDSNITPNSNYTYRLYALYQETEILLGETNTEFSPI